MRCGKLASMRHLGALIILALIGLSAQRAIAIVATCGIDADCDDGLVCNGPEICFSGFCILSGEGPCRELSCTEDGAAVYCDGRELVATAHASMGWSESAELDPALRIGLGVFQPSTGRLFDERTYAPADVGARFVATLGSDADLAGIAARLGDGVDDAVGLCRETTVAGLTSQSTCEPIGEHVFFGAAPDRPIGRIDLVLTSLTFTPETGGTSVSMTCDVDLLPEPSAACSQVALLLALGATRGARRRAAAGRLRIR